jgi:hypothetical protein
MKKFEIEVLLEQEMLGTAPGDPKVYEEYIAAKREANGVTEGSTEEELESLPKTLDEEVEKRTTFFARYPQNQEQPCLVNYHIKGFFKDACGMLRRIEGTLSKKLKAYKKEIDGLCFVGPRYIPITIPEGGEITYNERPIRVATPQGDRVALARSEQVPIGSTLSFTLTLLKDDLEGNVREWLDYGVLRGLGQWRNASFGSFTYTMTEVE